MAEDPDIQNDLPDPNEVSDDLSLPSYEDAGISSEENPDDFQIREAKADPDDIEQRVSDLEAWKANLVLPSSFAPMFPIVTGTGPTWNELSMVSGVLVPVGTIGQQPRCFTGDTVSGAAIIDLIAGQAVVIEMVDPASGVHRYLRLSPPAGLLQALGRITSVSGTHSAYVYTVAFQDGSTANSYNIKDWNGTTPGAMIGSPCSLGINVGASGQVNSGSCVIKAIGTTGGYFALTWDPTISRWTFNEQPSAQ